MQIKDFCNEKIERDGEDEGEYYDSCEAKVVWRRPSTVISILAGLVEKAIIF